MILPLVSAPPSNSHNTAIVSHVRERKTEILITDNILSKHFHKICTKVDFEALIFKDKEKYFDKDFLNHALPLD